MKQAIIDALKRLGKDSPSGMPKHSQVLEAARDEKSPLHECFTWDDGKAAAKYRSIEATALLNRVRVYIVPRVAKEPQRVSARMIPNDVPRETVHKPVPVLVNRLELAMNELRATRAKYADVHELHDVFQSIDQSVRKLSARGTDFTRDAVTCAQHLETKGLDRQSAIARAHAIYGVARDRISEGLRQTG